RDAMNKVLYEAIPALPYHAVEGLSSGAKADLEVMIQLFDQKRSKQLSAKWEPDRKLDGDVIGHVHRDLLQLLHGKREPYKPIKVSLEDARQNAGKYIELIEYTVPTKDCEKLLKAWDKNLKPFPKGRKEIVGRLLALVKGESPAKAPAPPPAKRPATATKDQQTGGKSKKGVNQAKAA
ncbi:MAG: hypothetical protein ACLPJW_01865, partial [Rhodomicrobium sp.]